jgi:hypothetical protein
MLEAANLSWWYWWGKDDDPRKVKDMDRKDTCNCGRHIYSDSIRCDLCSCDDAGVPAAVAPMSKEDKENGPSSS